MAVYKFYREPIFQYFKEQADFLINLRGKPENMDMNISLNMNIVLILACFVEGFMEKMAKCVLGYNGLVCSEVDVPEFEIRRSMNRIYLRMEEDLYHKISHSHGIDQYDKLYELLLGKSFKSADEFRSVMEPIKILFQLRNVIGHAKEISAYEVKAYWTDNIYQENFFGGYKNAEDFLTKKGIIKENFIETQSPENFFNDSVVDYFYQISIQFAELLQRFVEDNMEVGEILLDKLNLFNEKNNTNFSFLDFCEMNAHAAGDFPSEQIDAWLDKIK